MKRILPIVLFALPACDGDTTGPNIVRDVTYRLTQLNSPSQLGQVYVGEDGRCAAGRHAVEGGELTLRIDSTFTLTIEQWVSDGETGVSGHWGCGSPEPRDVPIVRTGMWSRYPSGRTTLFIEENGSRAEFSAEVTWPSSITLTMPFYEQFQPPLSGLAETQWMVSTATQP